MAVAKVLGIETEYGVSGGPDQDPILASSIIVNAYAQAGRTRINWDFTDEHPNYDARGVTPLTAIAPMVETHLANTVLTNGARLYVDHAHPEYSSPECRTPLQATLYDLAGEEVMRRALIVANESLPSHQQISLYKNNSDSKGNSYGTHENYLVDREVDFDDIVRAMVPHFVSRQILFGAGKLGAETEWGLAQGPYYQLSQRSEFFEEIIGLETTLKRPIVNTRDEPHSDSERFRRLHVINGDANLSHVATFVKLGSTALLLGALEEYGCQAFPPMPASPVSAIRRFALDPTLTERVATTDGDRSAWDYQDELWQLASRFATDTGGEMVAEPTEVADILSLWREILDALQSDRERASHLVDWVAKLRIIEGYRDRHGLRFDDPKLKAIDLQYHDIRAERSLSRRADLRELFAVEQIREAVHKPPHTTRAYFRGSCIEKFSSELVAANWDSLVFDTNAGSLQRVPMMDPLRGTYELTHQIIEQSATASALLAALLN